jgi:hypothetical protein
MAMGTMGATGPAPSAVPAPLVLLPVPMPEPPAMGWLLFSDASDNDKLKAISARGVVTTLANP